MRTPFSAFVDGTVARFVFVSALIPSVVSGLDGASSLPSLSFSYTSARLGGVDNGIGGAVRFSDERGKATVPLYRAGVYTAYEYGGACAGYYLSLSPNPVCGGTVAGYLMDSPVAGTNAPLYRAVFYAPDEYGGRCVGSYLSLSPNPACGGTVLGYLVESPVTETSPAIYRAVSPIYDEYGHTCDPAYAYPSLGPNSVCGGTVLGYLSAPPPR